MEESDQKKQINQKVTEVEIFPVKVAFGENNENLSIITNPQIQHSKNQLIHQAFKLHSEGNITEAIKYYEYFINQGFSDCRVFSNYGVILKDLGRVKEAELSQLKAIELNPNFAYAHANLGNVFRELGNLEKAESSQRKAIELDPDFAVAQSNLGSMILEN